MPSLDPDHRGYAVSPDGNVDTEGPSENPALRRHASDLPANSPQLGVSSIRIGVTPGLFTHRRTRPTLDENVIRPLPRAPSAHGLGHPDAPFPGECGAFAPPTFATYRFIWNLYATVCQYRGSSRDRRRDVRLMRCGGGAPAKLDGEMGMAGLVDILIPANGQAAAEALGLKVHRSVTAGARIRQIPRDEAEIAIECLRDWGITARVVEAPPQVRPATERGDTPAP
jgi:hypothetical protein